MVMRTMVWADYSPSYKLMIPRVCPSSHQDGTVPRSSHWPFAFWESAKFTPLPTYPGLVGSGTLTPECFVGCFDQRSRYFRVQPVFRPLDTRGSKAKLHRPLFTQLQVFSYDNPDHTVQMLLRFLKAISENRKAELSGNSIGWSSESIAARGVGREVFVDGIEVAQINEITHMGGVVLRQPACLLAIGLDRLELALRGVVGDLAPVTPLGGRISVHDLFELRDRHIPPLVDYERSLLEGAFGELAVRASLALLGDVQTEIDFQYAIGAISQSYRRVLIRSLRTGYKRAATNLHGNLNATNSANPLQYTPRWTVERLSELISPSIESSHAQAGDSSVKDENECIYETSLSRDTLKEAVKNAHRNVPENARHRTWDWTLDEFTEVIECEWSRTPDVQHRYGRSMRTEVGPADGRARRLHRICSAFLHGINRHGPRSEEMIERHNRLAIIEAASFLGRIAPMAAASNALAYLRRWNADSLDLKIGISRHHLKTHGMPSCDVDIESLSVFLAELVEVLIWRVERAGMRFSSSEDPARIKQVSILVVRIANHAGFDADSVFRIFRLVGAELEIPETATKRVFVDTFLRFLGRSVT